MDGLGFVPQNPRTFVTGGQVFNPGTAGPRTNFENQGAIARVWPNVYRIPARGLGAMPIFSLGAAPFVFNNAYAGGAPIYYLLIPGIGRVPFGG